MRFCISIPVFEQAEFLKTALESIRCQTEAFELAVLDASPDDNVQAVLKPYQYLVQYQYHHPDTGQAAAIQDGWNHTQGEIVAWLNADDYYFPETLAKVANVFRENPEIDVVYGHGVYVASDRSFQMYFPAINPNPATLQNGCIICQPSCFVRRSAMERVNGLNTDLHYVMDWDFWLRLYQAGCKFYFLNELLSVVRMHPATKTSSGAELRYQEIDQLLRENTNWLHRKIILKGFRHLDKQKNALLSWLRKCRQWSTRKHRMTIHGLECRTNQVLNHCEILLPWYDKNPIDEIIITTERPLNLQCQLDEQTIVLTAGEIGPFLFLDENLIGYQYFCKIDTYMPDEPCAIRTIRLESDKPWRLLGLELR